MHTNSGLHGFEINLFMFINHVHIYVHVYVMFMFMFMLINLFIFENNIDLKKTVAQQLSKCNAFFIKRLWEAKGLPKV